MNITLSLQFRFLEIPEVKGYTSSCKFRHLNPVKIHLFCGCHTSEKSKPIPVFIYINDTYYWTLIKWPLSGDETVLENSLQCVKMDSPLDKQYETTEEPCVLMRGLTKSHIVTVGSLTNTLWD